MEAAYPLFTVGAFFLGALHAVEPGHGKSIVAAYLIGTRGTTLEALLLGLTTAVTHLASVVAIAVVTLAASARYFPGDWEPLLGLLSGVTILAVGLWMLSPLLWATRPGRQEDREAPPSNVTRWTDVLLFVVAALAYGWTFVVEPLFFGLEVGLGALVVVVSVPAVQWGVLLGAGALPSAVESDGGA